MALAEELRDILGDKVQSGSHDYFPDLIRHLKPKHILELGTGAGTTAALIMEALSAESFLTTISWPNPPSGYPVGVKLEKWRGDERLRMITGDTISVESRNQIKSLLIDILFIDSDHRYEHIKKEMDLYKWLLKDGCLVVVDDLDHDDMMRFWDELPYDKFDISNVGFFRYELYR